MNMLWRHCDLMKRMEQIINSLDPFVYNRVVFVVSSVYYMHDMSRLAREMLERHGATLQKCTRSELVSCCGVIKIVPISSLLRHINNNRSIC